MRILLWKDLVEQVDAQELFKVILPFKWQRHCEIITEYMPPNPNEYTRPRIVVRYLHESDMQWYLRYSKGPQQGFFWDSYGDDLLSEGS